MNLPAENPALSPRSERKSLFVPVATVPPVEGCWSVNVSELGLGLVARPQDSSTGPFEGESIELEFALPSSVRIRAQGTVRWRHTTERESEPDATALGVHFTHFEGQGHVELRRFLAEHQVRAVVAGAPRGLERALELAFQGEVQLTFCSDPADVELALARGDLAAVLLCGDDEIGSVSLAHLIDQVGRAATEHQGRPEVTRPRVIFASNAAPERLVELFNAGAVDQVLPMDAPVSQLRDAVLDECRAHEVAHQQYRMAVELERLLRDRAQPVAHPPASADGPGFDADAMREVVGALRQVAPFKVTVLLQGETGSGKEVLAHRLHALSPRASAPFVVQDCGALPEGLLESELFGHVKGSFTGAVSDHPGLFVLADGGTVFLDEIENTTPALQARLLRVLETGAVRPVGGTRVRQVDVRVVAASNEDLAAAVKAGRFRADLYYRLNSFPIEVPPLRQRREGIVALARYFVDASNATLGKSARGFTPEAEGLLKAWSWPGNVRELRNVVERAVLLSAPLERLGPERLPLGLRRDGAPLAPTAKSLRARLAQVERSAIAEALATCGGVVRRAALELEMDAVTLARRARKLGLLDASTLAEPPRPRRRPAHALRSK